LNRQYIENIVPPTTTRDFPVGVEIALPDGTAPSPTHGHPGHHARRRRHDRGLPAGRGRRDRGARARTAAGDDPAGPAVYRAFYLAAGPWGATVAAAVLTFLAAALLALGGVTVGVDVVGGFDTRLAGGVAALVAAILVLVAAAAYAGVAGLLVALVAAGAFVVGVALLLHRVGTRRHSTTAFAGGVPVLVVLVLLLGVGLGWGGGYDIVAEEVPASSVGDADAEFADVPALRDDLLSPSGTDVYANCEEGDRRVCRLSLRGYAGEARAARFLARHGVRCPYLNGGTAGEESFVAVDGDTYYRVSCQAYGD